MEKIMITLAFATITLCCMAKPVLAADGAGGTTVVAAEMEHDEAAMPPAHTLEPSAFRLEPVPLLGALTAFSLLLTAFFAMFRTRIPNWLRFHKTAAYITILLMAIHASFAFFGWGY